MAKISKVIEELYQSEQWEKARTLLRRELRRDPTDHWYLTRLSGTYYEQHKYSKARTVSDRAVKLAPRCPLVLWDRAGIFDMQGQNSKALSIWKTLLKRGARGVMLDQCGEGLAWAKSLLNDCRYRIVITYQNVGKSPTARRYYREYMRQRAMGVKSIYSKREVKRIFEL